MCSPLICGTSNFPAEEHDIDELLGPCKAPKKPTRKIKDSKNPYANRGLDKFNALLAELESKKQKIYTQKGSQDISFIRFACSSSGEWKPIIVKTKGRIGSDENLPSNEDKHIAKNGKHHAMEGALKQVKEVVQETKGGIMSKNPQKRSSIRSRSWSLFKLEKLRQPSLYLVVMFILILLLLTIFGRTFTILCVSIGWYLLPLIKEKTSSSSSSSSSSLYRPSQKKEHIQKLSEKNVVADGSASPNNVLYKVKKKEYNRKLSERNGVMNGTASPISVLDGPEDKSPAKHAHRKSW